MKPIYFLCAVLLLTLASGCSSLAVEQLPTPLPADYLPTAAALTLQAQGVEALPSGTAPPLLVVSASASPSVSPNTGSPTPSQPALAAETMTPSPKATETAALQVTLVTPTIDLQALALTLTPLSISGNNPLTTTQTPTPAPPFPDAPVQIYRLGELSLLISPFDISARLTSGYGKVVRIELYGEDGRLLARHLKTYENIPWDAARIGMPIEFGISAAAEMGRLVISVEDPFGRLIDVNSVNLVLMSTGMTEIKPPTALWQRLIIQEPPPKMLIQGGKLVVSGRALLNNPDQPLRVMLVGEDGRVLGQRLAGVTVTIPGDYGTFVVEVPYQVSDLTQALLVIYEDGGPISEIAHLSSEQVILAP